ncbi:MAG: HD-GYP domain-containing protein [Actinomycetia bacterium]|jgi:hypothetical protein|nr:HD-GYP domain-containing protein [Actinomycetes bacterium]
MTDLPVRARLYISAAILAACVLVVLALLARPDWAVVISFAVLTVVLERTSTGVGNQSQGQGSIAFFMTLPTTIAAAILTGWAGATLVGAAGLLHAAPSRLPTVKRLFNGAQFTLSAAAAGLAFELLGTFLADGGPAALVLQVVAANVVYSVVNAGLLTAVLWLAQGAPPAAVLTGTIARTAPVYLGYGLLGVALAMLWEIGGPLPTVLGLLPLLVARWAFLQYAREREAYEATIRTLVKAVEQKDFYTRGHSERVSTASVMIARAIGMREERVTAIAYAGILHDVGKLGVPTKVLQKTGRLTEDEFAAIKRHPVRGREMLSDIEFLDEAFEGILHHHERMDGRGYPRGLVGDDIPEFARIIAVADAFDSMTSTRSYRDARTVPEAVRELQRCRGTQFDPVMVDAMVRALARQPWTHVPAPPPGVRVPQGAVIDHDDPTFVYGLPEAER